MCYDVFHACNRMRGRTEAHDRGCALSRWTEQTDVEQKPPRPYWTHSAASEGVAWCLWSVPNESVPNDDAPGQRECAGESISPSTRAHANDDSDDSIFLPPGGFEKSFYAVAKGRQTGIFWSWAECEASVKGYPSDFKGFATYEEAAAFLEQKGGSRLEMPQHLPHTLLGRHADGEDVSEVGPYDPQGLRRSQLATFPQHSTLNDWERGGERGRSDGTDNPRGNPTSPTSMSKPRGESSASGAYYFLCVCLSMPRSSSVCLSSPLPPSRVSPWPPERLVLSTQVRI